MLPVSLFVSENVFGLKPLYYANVNVQEVVKTKIMISNPSSDEDIVLQKAYSTEDFVTLKWLSADEPLVDQLTIKPGESKQVMTAHFSTTELVDHNAMVHLVLNTGHIMRMPLYYHVYQDIVKFLPSIVDFGVVPINFDLIRLPVSLKLRNGHKIN